MADRLTRVSAPRTSTVVKEPSSDSSSSPQPGAPGVPGVSTAVSVSGPTSSATVHAAGPIETTVTAPPPMGRPGESGEPGEPGPPGPPGPPGEAEVPDLPNLTILFENGLV